MLEFHVFILGCVSRPASAASRSEEFPAMELFAAAVLGTIQGITEFLPISSSAHLILAPWLLGWQPEGLTFDISLHLGTALAILGYFWRDWMVLARETVRGLVERKPFATANRKLAWYLVIGTIPAMLIGLPFEKYVEDNLRSPLIPAVTLVVFAAFLYFAEKWGSLERPLNNFSLADSLWIGISQALALIPGVSRSGITIGTGLLRNLDRPAAAKFSFLLATPVIVGAALLQGWHLLQAVHNPAALAAHRGIAGPIIIKWDVLMLGIASAAITGFLCIRYFLRYVQTRSFVPFVIYRIALAVVVLLYYLRQGA